VAVVDRSAPKLPVADELEDEPDDGEG